MQCPSCRFENLPGLEACGRCGTSLGLAGADIDVHPPRASRTAKRLRRLTPTRAAIQARDAVRDLRRGAVDALADDDWIEPPESGVLRRLVVPGWAQLHSGAVFEGRAFLATYLVLLVAGLLRWGTPFGSLSFGLACSVHAASIVNALVRESPSDRGKLFALSLALTALIYAPSAWVLSNVAAPIGFSAATAPFEAEDVVLVNHWAFRLAGPRRGDVVLIRPHFVSQRDVTALTASHRRDYLLDNQVVDRVVGLPGDRVAWAEGRLTVNGASPSWKPLAPATLPDHLEVVVPEGRFLVLPTTSAAAAENRGSASFWEEAGLVDADEILGGVWLRIAPVSRLWFIR